jgi:hypothetical protein
MIVELKMRALMMKITITAIENPLKGPDRCLLTIANRMNGKSSRPQASSCVVIGTV